MSDDFDPYAEWLGISPAEGPADHYALLGVERFEQDEAKIVAAANGRMELLRKFQNGKKAKLSQEMLNVISGARVCLLDKDRREEYDRKLRKRVDINALPAMKPRTEIFPKQVVSAEAFPIESRPEDEEVMLEPIVEKKPVFTMPHIPLWVYFTVVGLLSVLLMGYALYKSTIGATE